jgi:hypothetical protein
LRLMSLYSVFGAVAEAIPSIDKCHIWDIFFAVFHPKESQKNNLLCSWILKWNQFSLGSWIVLCNLSCQFKYRPQNVPVPNDLNFGTTGFPSLALQWMAIYYDSGIKT